MTKQEIIKALKKVNGHRFNRGDGWHWEAEINGKTITGNPMYTAEEIADSILQNIAEGWL